MKLETVKSVILSILIGISLLLTLLLWSYQPNYKKLTDTRYAEADIGGEDDVHEKDIVTPSSFVFHDYDNLYGFTDPKTGRDLYRDMQDWQMNNLKEKSANGTPEDHKRVELIFPVKLPMELADSLFTFEDGTKFPKWSFQRMFITFNQDSSMNVEFLSVNGNKRATAVINDAEQYNKMLKYMNQQDDLSDYIEVETDHLPIYIPKHSPELKERRFAMKQIDLRELVDVLFTNPEIVKEDRTKTDELYYTDSTRGMRVTEDRKSIKYFDPHHEEYEPMDPVDLLDISHEDINEQKGWIRDFNLDTLDASENLIRYRMYYAGYPVFNERLAIIEQEWHDEDLYRYERPAVRLSLQPGESTVELESGEQVLDYINESSDYDIENVEDIKPGYHLTDDKNESEESFYLTMEPVWYVKSHGSWQELDLDDTDEDKGGS